MTGVDLETMYKFMLENHAESYMLFFPRITGYVLDPTRYNS